MMPRPIIPTAPFFAPLMTKSPRANIASRKGIPRAFRQRNLEGINGHRDQSVIAQNADEFDHAFIPEQARNAPIGRIGNLALRPQLAGKFIDRILVLAREFWSFSKPDSFDRLGRNARLKRDRRMRLPFKPRLPKGAGDKDRELRKPRRQAGI